MTDDSRVTARVPWPARSGMPAPGGYIWRGRPRLSVTVRAIRSAESVYGKPYPVCLSCGGPMVTSLVVPALHCAACGLGYQAGL